MAVARARRILLVLALSGLLLPAATVTPVLADSVGTCAFTGEGTAVSPFSIGTAAKLACLRDNPAYWTSAFIQTADLDLAATPAWTTGIGTEETPFTGTYVGDDHEIANLRIVAGTGSIGLFGVTYTGAEIRHLALVHETVTITSDSMVLAIGGLVGRAYEGTFEEVSADVTMTVSAREAQAVGGLMGQAATPQVEISEASANVTLSVTATDGQVAVVGGLVGDASGISIGSSSSAGTIHARSVQANGSPISTTLIAGLVGAISGGTISGCSSSVDVTATSTAAVNGNASVHDVGGLVGFAYNTNTTITSSKATGDVHVTSTAAVYRIGGLVGYDSGGALRDSSAAGAVVAVSQNDSVGSVGGLIGHLEGGTASGSAALGSVSATSAGTSNSIGGLVGSMLPLLNGYTVQVYDVVADSFARGAVSAPGGSSIGGLVGYAQDGSIDRSYATGAVTGATYTGGLVGALDATEPTDITGPSFWNTATTGWPTGLGQGSDADAVGLPTAAMLLPTTYQTGGTSGASTWTADWALIAGWEPATDHGNVWGICSTANGGYPFLLALPAQTPCVPMFTTGTTVTLRTGVTLPSASTKSAVPVRVSWAAVGGAAALKTYVLERSLNGGAFTKVTLAQPLATSILTTVPSTGSVAFRVTATNLDGRTMTSTSPTRSTSLVQQTSSAVKYSGSWTTVKKSAYSGGSLRWAKARNATATVSFTGRSIALVVRRASLRGKVTLYVDGAKVKTLDLRGASSSRYIAWSWAGTSKAHKLKIVVAGTSGRPRIDLDGFVVVK